MPPPDYDPPGQYPTTHYECVGGPRDGDRLPLVQGWMDKYVSLRPSHTDTAMRLRLGIYRLTNDERHGPVLRWLGEP